MNVPFLSFSSFSTKKDLFFLTETNWWESREDEFPDFWGPLTFHYQFIFLSHYQFRSFHKLFELMQAVALRSVARKGRKTMTAHSEVNMSLFRAGAIDVCIQLGGCALSIPMQTERFFDLLGTGTFVVMNVASLLSSSLQPRQILATSCVVTWAFRLGAHLVRRVRREGKDRRFDGVRDNPPKFAAFWAVQAVWCFITSLPTLAVNAYSLDQPSLGVSDLIGFSLWFCGFVMEATADWQKAQFRADPRNRGKFIASGLWRWSRHPNYFGEMLSWIGLATACSRGVRLSPSALVRAYPWIGPTFEGLLICFLSGIPLLERQADSRWGGRKDYEEYKRKTPLLIPYLF